MKSIIINYNDYIQNRLNDSKSVSNPEKDALSIMHNGESDDFQMIVFHSRTLDIYWCETVSQNGSVRLKISSFEEGIPHSLQDVFSEGSRFSHYWPDFYRISHGRYTYDKYYDRYLLPAGLNERLEKALSFLRYYKGNRIYFKGEYCEYPPLLYMLQQYCQSVAPVPECRIDAFGDEFLIPSFIEKEQIALSDGERAISYFGGNDVPIYVPMEKETLDSVFVSSIRWRDILPDMNPDCSMAGICFKKLKLSFDSDGYQNVFVTVTDDARNSIRLLVYDAFTINRH